MDGSGNSGYVADVAIESGRVAGVGDLSDWQATARIDGTDRVLAPGFIDVHAHDDLAVLATPDMTFKVSQGVTTVINGNCGVSAAPLPPADSMPAPYPLLGDAGDFRYPSVRSYRAAVEASPPAVNMALLVGHSSLRLAFVAESIDEPASPRAIALMSEALDTALRQGGIGLSSGLEYPPASAAPTDELVALASVLQGHEGSIYTTHVRNEGDGVVEAVREALDTGRRAGVSTVISHHKCVGRRNYGRTIETLDLIRRGAETGDVAIDVYPYTASATSLLPDFVDNADSILISWSETHPEWAGRTLDDAAASWGCDRRAAAARLDPAGAVYFQIDEADLCRVLAHERSMIGSDGIAGRGLPHPRLWGTFPRVLARYVRESGLLTLTDAIHKMTGLPASVFGLDGRGLIAVGAAADLVLFDPVTIEDAASYEEPEQPARGLSHVFVNGELTWTDGAHTGARAGRFITRRLTGVATR